MVGFAYHGNLIAQVGIGTTSPQETLHIAGTARIDSLHPMVSNRVVVADSVGKLGYKLSTSSALFEYGISIAEDHVLVNPNFIGQYVRNDIDLDLRIAATVAPNSTSIIRVEYSVPLGSQNCLVPGMEMLTYIGVTFYRDGTEVGCSIVEEVHVILPCLYPCAKYPQGIFINGIGIPLAYLPDPLDFHRLLENVDCTDGLPKIGLHLHPFNEAQSGQCV